MIYTTLSRIREHSPCPEGWRRLLAHLDKTSADDKPLAYSTILESNGLDDALWCLRAEPQHANLWRMYAVSRARSVQHLMTDPRSIAAIVVAERHALGAATDADLGAAWGAARDAARAAASAADSAADSAAAWGDFLAMVTAYDAAPGCVKSPAVREVP